MLYLCSFSGCWALCCRGLSARPGFSMDRKMSPFQPHITPAATAQPGKGLSHTRSTSFQQECRTSAPSTVLSWACIPSLSCLQKRRGSQGSAFPTLDISLGAPKHSQHVWRNWVTWKLGGAEFCLKCWLDECTGSSFSPLPLLRARGPGLSLRGESQFICSTEPSWVWGLSHPSPVPSKVQGGFQGASRHSLGMEPSSPSGPSSHLPDPAWRTHLRTSEATWRTPLFPFRASKEEFTPFCSAERDPGHGHGIKTCFSKAVIEVNNNLCSLPGLVNDCARHGSPFISLSWVRIPSASHKRK